MESTIKKTALYETHLRLKANIVNFNGTYLPLFYSSIQEEHRAVRNSLGIFDVSHMGNIVMKFPDRNAAVDFYNYILANDFSGIQPGKCIYSTMLNPDGTVIDDLIVMSITENEYHIIVNASNIDKDFIWIKENVRKRGIEIETENLTDYYSILAVQGPKSGLLMADELKFPVSGLKSFRVMRTKYNGKSLYISSTGYTGERGYEFITERDAGISLFEDILNSGKKYDILPCGLGARDTLRLEAGLPLYGHELDDRHSPMQANIDWSVKPDKPGDFIGKFAILNDPNGRFRDMLTGFEVLGKAIPRSGMKILSMEEKEAGFVTSGTFSPTLQKNIGMAYINPHYISEDPELNIIIRNRTEKIKLMKLPFYKRTTNQ